MPSRASMSVLFINDKCRMSNDEGRLNAPAFVKLRRDRKMTKSPSSFIHHWSFVLRHFSANISGMKLIEVPAPAFDLAMTLDSGQVFHWEECGEGFVGAIADMAVYVEQRGNVLKVRGRETPTGSPRRRPLSRIVANYFALDHPLAEICAAFPDDQIMEAARNFCRGLRIIRQPKWECLATFICSSMKQ